MPRTVALLGPLICLSVRCAMHSDGELEQSRQLALARAALIDNVPAATLVVEAVQPPVRLKRIVWSMRDPSLEPPMPRVIATEEGRSTLWLNNPSDTRELGRFLDAEGLFDRVPASTLSDVIFTLGFQDFEVMHRSEDLKEVVGADVRVSRLLQEFFPPRFDTAPDRVLTCWTWGRHSGDLEIWTIELRRAGLSLARRIVEKNVGLTLPKL